MKKKIKIKKILLRKKQNKKKISKNKIKIITSYLQIKRNSIRRGNSSLLFGPVGVVPRVGWGHPCALRTGCCATTTSALCQHREQLSWALGLGHVHKGMWKTKQGRQIFMVLLLYLLLLLHQRHPG